MPGRAAPTQVIFVPNTPDDPGRRRPEISKAKALLGWEPKVPLREGLPLMIDDFKRRIASGEHHVGLANMLSKRGQARRDGEAGAAAAVGAAGGRGRGGGAGGGAAGGGGAGAARPEGYRTEQADD